MKPSVRYDMTVLNRFVAGLDTSRKLQVKVGIMADSKPGARGMQKNVDIGTKHEWGDPENHVPQRSFLRWPIFAKAKDIVKDTSLAGKAQLLAGNIRGVLAKLGVACETQIGLAFASGGFGMWAPLAPFTVEKKGHSLILIETRQLERAVTSAVVKK